MKARVPQYVQNVQMAFLSMSKLPPVLKDVRITAYLVPHQESVSSVCQALQSMLMESVSLAYLIAGLVRIKPLEFACPVERDCS